MISSRVILCGRFIPSSSKSARRSTSGFACEGSVPPGLRVLVCRSSDLKAGGCSGWSIRLYEGLPLVGASGASRLPVKTLSF